MRFVILHPLGIRPNLRRIASVGLAFGLVGSVVATPISTVDGYYQRYDEIEVLTAEVERLRKRVVARVGRDTPDTSTGDDLSGILAPDAESAAAHLQGTLRGLATTLGSAAIQVDSVRVLPSLTEGNATAVRASASMKMPGALIFDVVNALEASSPSVVLDSLRVVSRSEAVGAWGRGTPKSENVSGELTLALRVYARSDAATPEPSKPSGKRASREDRRP